MCEIEGEVNVGNWLRKGDEEEKLNVMATANCVAIANTGPRP